MGAPGWVRPDGCARVGVTDGRRQATANAPSETTVSSTSSAYARASCEYQTKIGLTATSPAATSAARSSTNRRAVAKASGTVAVPIRADSDRIATSLVPNSFVHTNASR